MRSNIPTTIEFNEYDNAYYLGSEENPYMWLWQTKTDSTSCIIHKDTKHIRGGLDKVTEIVIPDGVLSIGSYVFSHDSSFTSVVIPDSVTSIDDYAFSDCDNLTMVVLGTGIKSIGYKCFSDGNDNLRLCYKGSPEGRDNNEIHISNGNPSLTYYSESNPYDVSPDDDDYYLIMNRSYWHYDVDGKTVLLWSKQA